MSEKENDEDEHDTKFQRNDADLVAVRHGCAFTGGTYFFRII